MLLLNINIGRCKWRQRCNFECDDLLQLNKIRIVWAQLVLDKVTVLNTPYASMRRSAQKWQGRRILNDVALVASTNLSPLLDLFFRWWSTTAVVDLICQICFFWQDFVKLVVSILFWEASEVKRINVIPFEHENGIHRGICCRLGGWLQQHHKK